LAWFIDQFKLDVDYRVIEMRGWQPDEARASAGRRADLDQPEPQCRQLNMARAYAGTVMLEGTTLSEGRGTTRPLELFGAPDIEPLQDHAEMERSRPAGCRLQAARDLVPADVPQACRRALPRRVHPRRRAVLRPCYFKPWRLQALAFKAIRASIPTTTLARFPYEYVFDKLAIDVINGSPVLRGWVEDPNARAGDLDAVTLPDERDWEEQSQAFRIY
jgi:hypothetical protein